MNDVEKFNLVKVFSATKARDRIDLGDVVTEWLKGITEKGGTVVDRQVLQSSDHEFHCLSIILFVNLP